MQITRDKCKMLEGIQNHYTLIKENNHVLHHTTTAKCHQSEAGAPPLEVTTHRSAWRTNRSSQSYLQCSHLSLGLLLQPRVCTLPPIFPSLRSILNTTYSIMPTSVKTSHCHTVMVIEPFKPSSKQPLQRHYPSLTRPYIRHTEPLLFFLNMPYFIMLPCFYLVLFAVSSPSFSPTGCSFILHYLAQTPLSL